MFIYLRCFIQVIEGKLFMFTEVTKPYLAALKYFVVGIIILFAYLMYDNSFLSSLFIALAALSLTPLCDLLFKTDSEGRFLIMTILLLIGIALMKPLYPAAL